MYDSVVDFAALRRVVASLCVMDWGRMLAAMWRCIWEVLGSGGGERELNLGLEEPFWGWTWAVMFVVTVGDVVGRGGGATWSSGAGV